MVGQTTSAPIFFGTAKARMIETIAEMIKMIIVRSLRASSHSWKKVFPFGCLYVFLPKYSIRSANPSSASCCVRPTLGST